MEEILEEFQELIDEKTATLSDSDYLDLLKDIIHECKIRIEAKQEEMEGQEDE